jgi:hypothetical protein
VELLFDLCLLLLPKGRENGYDVDDAERMGRLMMMDYCTISLEEARFAAG